jgi:hypothetical protein
MVDEKGKSSTAGEQQKQKYQGRWFQGRRQEGEKKEYIPILKYGKGNNYYQFQQALYKKAIRIMEIWQNSLFRTSTTYWSSPNQTTCRRDWMRAKWRCCEWK